MILHLASLVGMEQIGIATLRPNLTSILKRVEAGDTVVAVHHEHPRAVLVPPSKYQAMQDIIRSVGIDPDTLRPSAAKELTP